MRPTLTSARAKHALALSAIALLGAASALPPLLPTKAAAAGVLQISGVVQDGRGTALAGASVSDGQHVSTTDSSGSYQIQELQLGTYSVTASASGMQSQTARVTLSATSPSATQNFTLLFRSTSSLDHTIISTMNGSVTLTDTLLTFAPNPGTSGQAGESCATVTDSLRGTAVPMTYVGVTAGQYEWTWSNTLGQNTTEGAYSLTEAVKDCASGSQLDQGSTVPYTVDNTPPFIDPTSIRPSDFGNTVFTSQPLIAKITDSGSGVQPSSIQFTLTNVTTAAQATYPAVSFTAPWAYTTPVSLVVGDVYNVTVTASDYAANATTASQSPDSSGGGFVATTEGINATSGSMPSVPCTLTSNGTTSTTKTATCPNVLVSLDATSVSLGGERSAPVVGYVDQTVALTTAVISTTVAGAPVSVPAYQSSDPNWAPKTGAMPFNVDTASASSSTVTVPSHQVNVGTLITQVPKTWTSASLSMASVSTTAATETCANPVVASPPFSCEPDPLQSGYEVQFKPTVSDPNGVANAEASLYNLNLNEVDVAPPGYKADVPLGKLAALRADSNVASVTRCAAAGVQNTASACLTSFSLDNVDLTLSAPVLPSVTIPTSPTGAGTQEADAVSYAPIFQELTVTAVPYGFQASDESLPPAQAGGASTYLADLRSDRQNEGGQILTPPPAKLFGQSVNGIASIVNLHVSGSANVQTLIAEWVADAGSRLWIVRISQQLNGPVAAVPLASLTGLVLSSNNLSAATSMTTAGTSSAFTTSGVGGNTTWWNGDCDTNTYRSQTGQSSYRLGASFMGLVACGPGDWADNGNDALVRFFSGAWGVYEWECVELSMRWLYLAYGVNPYSANGSEVVWNYSGSTLSKVSNGTPNSAPQPGDVLSFGSTKTAGHTAVVTASNVDSSGNGSITVIEQNYSRSGSRTISVSGWYVGNSASGWLHGPTPSGAPPQPTGTGGTYCPTAATVGSSTTHYTNSSSSNGYWLVSDDGGVFTYGNGMTFYGGMGGQRLNAPMRGMARTADGGGYWLVGGDGGVFAFGDATFYGSMANQALNACVVGMVSTSDARGYWLVAADGGVFAFGDAGFHGSMGGRQMNAPVVAMVATNDNGGYWLIGADGGIFAFGDAPFKGAATNMGSSSAFVSGASSGDSQGYWLVNRNGQIYAFGDAQYHGGLGNSCGCTASLASTPSGNGYWILTSDGGVHTFGGAWYYSNGSSAFPFVGMASLP